MRIQAISSILSSAGIKISSMLMVVFFAKHMAEDDFGMFSYLFSLIVTLATIFSYIIGQTWAKLCSEHKNIKIVALLVIVCIFASFMVSTLITFMAGYSFGLMLIVGLSSALAMLSYSGLFVSLYLGYIRIALLASGAAVLSLSGFVFFLESGFLKLNKENALNFLALFYFLQAPCWVSLLGQLVKTSGEKVRFRWLLNFSSKYFFLSLMGAPVHFLCMTMLAIFSGVKDVGLFNLSFQMYVAALFFVTSLQPAMLKFFSGNVIGNVYKFSLFSIFMMVSSVCLYWVAARILTCSDISIFCLDGRLVVLSFSCALFAGNNTILMQYINANYDPSINIRLQFIYAAMYLLSSLLLLWAGGGVWGLYGAILMSSFILLVIQVLTVRKMRDGSYSANAG